MKAIVFAIAATGLLNPASAQPAAPPQQPRPPRVVPGEPGSPRETLGGNYRLTLAMTQPSEEPLELSVVTESPVFMTSLGDKLATFEGTVRPADPGSFTISYRVGWRTKIPSGTNNNFEYRDSLTSGSVTLKLGETIEIFKAGGRAGELSISAAGAKAK